MKFQESFLITAYELARDGMSNKKIGETIGCNKQTFINWLRKKPALKEAITRGRTRSGSRVVTDFREYVYSQLPDNLKKLWDKINHFHEEGNSLSKIEALLQDQGAGVRKHLFLYALVNSNFNPSQACRMVNLPFKTFRGWCEHDPEFQELVEEINIHKGNFFEGALLGLVASGDTSATVFANRTFNANRGYNPKSEINVNINGQVNHKIGIVKVDTLNLPLEVRKQILDATRQKALPAPREDIVDAEFTKAEVDHDDTNGDETEVA